MAAITLEEVKGFLRIDGGEEDTILALLLSAAKEYLANAGVPEPEESSDGALYKLAVMVYISFFNENRDPGAKIEMYKPLTSIILQLKT